MEGKVSLGLSFWVVCKLREEERGFNRNYIKFLDVFFIIY